MLKLKRADYPGTYHGFTLKEGYYYGMDTENSRPLGTSGWESNNCVYIYTLTEGKWIGEWYDIEDTDFEVSNYPEPVTEGKLSFNDWLEFDGIDPNDFDENYSAQMARELEESYNDYYYDGLPKFVQKYL